MMAQAATSLDYTEWMAEKSVARDDERLGRGTTIIISTHNGVMLNNGIDSWVSAKKTTAQAEDLALVTIALQDGTMQVNYRHGLMQLTARRD